MYLELSVITLSDAGYLPKVGGTRYRIYYLLGILGTYVTCILQPLVDYMYLLHTVTVSDGRIESR